MMNSNYYNDADSAASNNSADTCDMKKYDY